MTVGKIISISLVVLVLGFAGPAKASTVEFNLFDLGCPTVFGYNSSHWRVNLDIEDTFSDISHVYIDWSGEFTASFVLYDPTITVSPGYPIPPPPDDPTVPFPVNVSLYASFYRYPLDCTTSISGGESAYPAPEPFAVVSELPNRVGWIPKGMDPYITLRYLEPMDYINIEYGSLTLNNATLIIEGTVIPEPATLLLLGLGAVFLKKPKNTKPN